MAKMNFTPADDLVDEVWGKMGTPERDAMEAQLKEEINAYFVGEATKSHTRRAWRKGWSKKIPNIET